MVIERCERCVESLISGTQAVADCLPVPCVGDPTGQNLKVVTIGLNPALNEFFNFGIPKRREHRLALVGDYRRVRRSDLRDEDVKDSQRRCAKYFNDSERGWHPYFEKMEHLLTSVHSGWSYYWGSAVHLDLVACATKERWSKLDPSIQGTMIDNCRGYFLEALNKLPDKVVILCDGKRVTSEINELGLKIEWRPDELIQIHPEDGGNVGRIGELELRSRKHRICGWESYVSHMNPTWRLDLALWVHGVIFPKTPLPGLAALI